MSGETETPERARQAAAVITEPVARNSTGHVKVTRRRVLAPIDLMFRRGALTAAQWIVADRLRTGAEIIAGARERVTGSSGSGLTIAETALLAAQEQRLACRLLGYNRWRVVRSIILDEIPVSKLAPQNKCRPKQLTNILCASLDMVGHEL